MSKNLVVIEAPGKITSLRAALARGGLEDFEIFATGGHLMKMPDALWPIGIDDMLAETAREARDPEQLERLRTKALACERVLVATDADQEGDVVAWDVACVLAKHPNVKRVRLRALDFLDVASAFSHPEPISHKDAWPGTARRILDRLIGAKFSASGMPGNEDVFVGRVQSALLGAVRGGAPACAKLVMTLSAADRHGPFVAEVALHAQSLQRAPELLRRARGLAELGPAAIAKSVPAKSFRPWSYGQAVLEIAEATQRPIQDVADSLQRLYEGGKMSYPRSSASAITDDALACLRRIADTHGVRFDTSRVSQFSQNARHAHESPRPVTDRVDICAPLLVLAPDDAALSLITRQLIACGQPHLMQAPDLSGLPESMTWARELPWQRRVSQWLRPWPRRAPEAHVQRLSADAVLLRVLLNKRLGRPSTVVSHAIKFASRALVDEYFRLTERAQRWIDRTPEILLEADTSSLIESIIDTSAERKADYEPPDLLVRGILERLGLWADIQPALTGGAAPRERAPRASLGREPEHLAAQG